MLNLLLIRLLLGPIYGTTETHQSLFKAISKVIVQRLTFLMTFPATANNGHLITIRPVD